MYIYPSELKGTLICPVRLVQQVGAKRHARASTSWSTRSVPSHGLPGEGHGLVPPQTTAALNREGTVTGSDQPGYQLRSRRSFHSKKKKVITNTWRKTLAELEVGCPMVPAKIGSGANISWLCRSTSPFAKAWPKACTYVRLPSTVKARSSTWGSLLVSGPTVPWGTLHRKLLDAPMSVIS